MNYSVNYGLGMKVTWAPNPELTMSWATSVSSESANVQPTLIGPGLILNK